MPSVFDNLIVLIYRTPQIRMCRHGLDTGINAKGIFMPFSYFFLRPAWILRVRNGPATLFEYICKTKTAVTRIKIDDIYYLKIQTHTITIHTEHGTYQKYGSLTNEQKFLAPYGFIRCRQNCLVSLPKVYSICNNTINLTNHLQLHMSQRYAPTVLASFTRSRISR